MTIDDISITLTGLSVLILTIKVFLVLRTQIIGVTRLVALTKANKFNPIEQVPKF